MVRGVGGGKTPGVARAGCAMKPKHIAATTAIKTAIIFDIFKFFTIPNLLSNYKEPVSVVYQKSKDSIEGILTLLNISAIIKRCHKGVVAERFISNLVILSALTPGELHDL